MLEEMVSENQIGVQNNGYYTLQHFCIENSSAHYLAQSSFIISL
jgi:hypothetical protein